MSEGPRQSNFELLRIVAMFAIVAHHYVVNSSVLNLNTDEIGYNWYFIRLFMFGKVFINPFVLISGYFMCTSNLTMHRFLKIFATWVFYSLIAWVIFGFVGYDVFSFKRMSQILFAIFTECDVYFTASFIWFYVGIPFYNKLIGCLKRDEMIWLLVLLLSMFTIPISLFNNMQVFSHIFWYMTLYFLGAYLRLYPPRWSQRQIIPLSLLIIGIGCWAFGMISRVILPDQIGRVVGGIFSIHESSNVVSLMIGLSVFLLFKNLRLKYNKWINVLASCMFGVLCIHAVSWPMRYWLWQEVCRVPQNAAMPMWYLAAHMVACVVIIMVVCSLIDLVRQKLIENPISKCAKNKGWF